MADPLTTRTLHRAARFMALLALGSLHTAAPAVGQQTAATDPAAIATRANANYLAGNYAQALVDFDQILASGMHDGHTLYRAGHCQKMTGKPRALMLQTMSRAISELDRTVHVEQGDPQLIDFDYLASAYAVIGDRNTARLAAADGIKAYREGRFGNLTDLSPIEAFHLGRLGSEVGDSDLLILALGRFIVSEQSAPTQRIAELGQALADVGAAHLELRRFDKAAAALGMALDTVPAASLPGMRFSHAVALFHLGEYKEAGLTWEKVRLEDPIREAQAGYAVHAMRTLSQKGLLMDETNPLPDLTASTPADLEQMLLSIGTEMAQLGANVPPKALQRGYNDRKATPKARASMRRYRDLKVRLAYAAAEYAARGLQIREFAFTSGLQSGLMSWRHLPRLPSMAVPGEIPTSLVGAELVEEYERKAIERRKLHEKRAAEQAARRSKKPSTGKNGNGSSGDAQPEDAPTSDGSDGADDSGTR